MNSLWLKIKINTNFILIITNCMLMTYIIYNICSMLLLNQWQSMFDSCDPDPAAHQISDISDRVSADWLLLPTNIKLQAAKTRHKHTVLVVYQICFMTRFSLTSEFQRINSQNFLIKLKQTCRIYKSCQLQHGGCFHNQERQWWCFIFGFFVQLFSGLM